MPRIDDVPKQRILLMNLYLNQIFNTLLLNNTLKKKHEKSSISTSKFVNLTIISKYKNINADYTFSLPNFPVPPKYDEKYSKIISKVNSLLDEKKLISPVCADVDAAGGAKNKNKYNHSKNLIKRRKQKTIKKKIQNMKNIKNKKSLKSKIKNKINKKIKKCVKKCVKKNINQQKQQQENKYRIKKILESKIHQKINKLKLNKTKNWSKNKSYHSQQKYTRKNY